MLRQQNGAVYLLKRNLDRNLPTTKNLCVKFKMQIVNPTQREKLILGILNLKISFFPLLIRCAASFISFVKLSWLENVLFSFAFVTAFFLLHQPNEKLAR